VDCGKPQPRPALSGSDLMATTSQRPLTRACIDCGATLPPDRRGFYCAEHGRESNGTPHAPVSVVWSSRSRYWAVTVLRCPYCQRKHFHGGGDGSEPDLGARRSHCITGDGGTYELIETAESLAARTLPDGCIGPACAVEIGPGRRSRCSGCGS
jgi:hypothetical protein